MIKISTLDGIKNYVEKGIPPGGFIYAVLTNNLVEAVGRADDENLAALGEIVNYIYSNIPLRSWGSEEKVNAYLKEKYEEYQKKLGVSE